MILYKDFTAVIPAAGKGSRFDENKNKLLYKIKGKTIFENVLDKITSFSNNIVIIVSKDNLYEIKNIASHKKYQQIKFVFVLQRNANGMGHAINLAMPKVKTKNFFLIWADQLGISTQTIKKSIIAFITRSNHCIVFPTIKKSNPYTLVVKNKSGLVNKVLQSREESLEKKFGETDCGFFVCNTSIIKFFLKNLINNKLIITKKTKEYDFLKSFKYISKKNLISTVPAEFSFESKGINTKKDLEYLLKKI